MFDEVLISHMRGILKDISTATLPRLLDSEEISTSGKEAIRREIASRKVSSENDHTQGRGPNFYEGL